MDEESLRGLIRFHLDSGTDGIVALGTTGEASVLTASERQLVLDIAAEETGGEMPLMAGTSSVNPLVVIEQIQQVCAPTVAQRLRGGRRGRNWPPLACRVLCER